MNISETACCLVEHLKQSADNCDLPECIYLSAGKPAIDQCEGGLIAVYLGSGSDNGVTSNLGGQGCAGTNFSGQIIVEIWDCVPTECDYEAESVCAKSLNDLMVRVYGASLEGLESCFDGNCTHITGVFVEPLDSEGGCGGWKITFDVKP